MAQHNANPNANANANANADANAHSNSIGGGHSGGPLGCREEEASRLHAMHPVLKELLSGGVAGATAKTAVAPLERVKILYQTGSTGWTPTLPSSSTAGTSSRARGGAGGSRSEIAGVIRDIVRAEGAVGLWKGNAASVLRIVPYASIHFSAYEQYRTLLLDCLESLEGPPTSRWRRSAGALARSPVVDLVAGSLAGATAVLATYPLDLLRTRLAWKTSAIAAAEVPAEARATRPKGMLGTLRGIVARDGMRGLYRGVGPTVLGIFPYSGLKFYVYQSLKHRHWRASGLSGEGTKLEDVRFPTHVKLGFGAVSGLLAQTVTYPLDVVRRRMQVQDMTTHARSGLAVACKSGSKPVGGKAARVEGGEHIRGTLHGLKVIARMGLRKGLYAGLSINYMKVVPSTAIGFAVYDTMKEVLHHKTSI